MKMFVANAVGGVDVCNQDGEILVRLDAEELMALHEIQEKKYDVDAVMDRIPDWVGEKIEEDDTYAEFNSSVFSSDEISEDEICEMILSNGDLLGKIAGEYRARYNESCQWQEQPSWWDTLNGAIESHISIKDVMGEILGEKLSGEAKAHASVEGLIDEAKGRTSTVLARGMENMLEL